ncbi:acyl-CoA thioester hydrolase [Streptomyces sp. SAI-208]|nr:acyl-CoA thioester hydrolase [Streptomyces sp. SAI-208]
MIQADLPQPVPAPDFGVLMPVRVHFGDLDPFGMLHNTRYNLLVERACNMLWETTAGERLGDDEFVIVKKVDITYEAPVHGAGLYAVQLWVTRLGTSSATWAYRFCSTDAQTIHAHGTRTHIRLDRNTLRPAPWSDEARVLAKGFMGPLS